VTAIECAGLSCGYASPRVVLGDVDLTIGRRELVCLLGVNGAGKTTLLRTIAGLLPPHGGSVRVLGQDPARAPRRALARALCYLPQSYDLSVPFTVSDVVIMGRYPYHRSGFSLETDEDHAIARAAMERCDVLALAERRFDALSGGEQRRALLAQALCQQTEVLLLDEPTASLDPAHAIAIFTALHELRAQATVVVVTHDLNLAARFADRVGILAPGGPDDPRARLVAIGPPAEIFAAATTAAAFGISLHAGTVPGSGHRYVVPH
jgi:iron complex transport system ATP-binding protein